MEKTEDTRNRDAQILASLRRRGTDASSPAAEEQDENKSRADALRRLRTSNAPKETMSSVSPTIRSLRREASDPDEVVAPHATASVHHAETEEPRRQPHADSASVREIMVVSKLFKSYAMGKKAVPVLRGVDLSVRQGEFLAVVGQSGSGKSTLLHLMGTLDVPDSGTIYFDGQRIDNLSLGQRDVLRNHFIGMIFQFYHLLPELTTLENVLAPLMIRDNFFGYMRRRSQYVQEAKELLELVGLSHRLKHRPNELSGGEMQRASIARALISKPRLLLADEPTGNLDSKASAGVLDLLRELNHEKKLTVVMVTHDMGQARDADRAIRIVDGQVVQEGAAV